VISGCCIISVIPLLFTSKQVDIHGRYCTCKLVQDQEEEEADDKDKVAAKDFKSKLVEMCMLSSSPTILSSTCTFLLSRRTG